MFRAFSQSICLLAVLILGMSVPALAAPGEPNGSAVAVVGHGTAKVEDYLGLLVIGDDAHEPARL